MTDITELAQLKPGKYAILYRDNWDGEKNEYHTLAVLTEEGGWYDDEFNAELLKYQGDKILKVWPMDDGSNVLVQPAPASEPPVAPNFKKLARELVDNLVDCGGLDEGVEERYLKWTEKVCRAAMLAAAPPAPKSD